MMTHRCTCLRLSTAVVVVGLFLVGGTRCPAAEPSPGASPATGEDVEPLLRGPLHEAFAEPIQLNPQPAPVVPKQPPEVIEELPPEAKPADENVIWIPGYWAWDEDREDFIYISGVWRVAPEGRRWVPGYWAQVDGGYQWVSGFWAPIEAEEIQYLPYPPESLEAGPSSPTPSTEHYWVSGNWCYQNDRYAWRPGYWNTFREGWVWVPAHYVWTPGGAVFIDGYWDCPFRRRGVVFAPVWFPRAGYLRHGFRYTPSVMIDIPHLLVHLFVYPRRCHYYWGDYYDYYLDRGRHFYRCYDYHGRHGYDPVFAYHDAYHRHRHIDYTQRLRGWHDYFRDHKEFRPPHTLHGQTQLAARAKHNADLQYALLGNRLDDVLSRRGGPTHFERISQTHRQSWNDAISQTRELTRRRVDIETQHKTFDLDRRDGSPTRGDGPAKFGGKVDTSKPPVKLKLPELPRVAGFQSKTVAPERFDQRRSAERAEVHKTERGDSGPDRIRFDSGTVSQSRKRSEGTSTQPGTRTLPDFSKLHQSESGSSRNAGPKVETPRIPGFRQPDLGSDRQPPSFRNPNGGGPRVTSPRTAPPSDRTTTFKLPDRVPGAGTTPAPDRTFTLPDRRPSVRIPAPRIETPAARQEVRRAPVTIPRLPSASPPPSRNRNSNLQSPSSVARPRSQMPSSFSGVDRSRSESPSRQMDRSEFRGRDFSGPRSQSPRIDTNRHGSGRTPGSGRDHR